jgi:hypothetical protein
MSAELYSAGNRRRAAKAITAFPFEEDQGIDENHQRFRPRLLNAGEGRFEVLRDDINHHQLKPEPPGGIGGILQLRWDCGIGGVT